MPSINDKLERIRKPRVHIKYEVETENGTIEKELPFVVGVMGDFSGNNSSQEKKPLKERKFTAIDRDNFDQVMQRMSPGLSIRTENKLLNDGSEMAVNLQFNKLDDFEPSQLVEQIPALQELMVVRNKLRDLLTKSDRSDVLEAILERTLQDNNSLMALATELRIEFNKNNE